MLQRSIISGVYFPVVIFFYDYSYRSEDLALSSRAQIYTTIGL